MNRQLLYKSKKIKKLEKKQKNILTNETNCDIIDAFAGMAELADALDSGSSGGNFVEVQVLLPAPTEKGYALRIPFLLVLAMWFAEPSHATGVLEVRLRSKGTIERSEICSTVPFPAITFVIAFFLVWKRTGRTRPHFSGTGEFCLQNLLLSAAKYVQLSRLLSLDNKRML